MKFTDFYAIGKCSGSWGKNGEMKIKQFDNFPIPYQDDFIFIDIYGTKVPFRIVKLQAKKQLILLSDITTQNEADALKGKIIFTTLQNLPNQNQVTSHSLQNYLIFNQENDTLIGKVVEVLINHHQELLVVEAKTNKIYIPYIDSWVVQLDDANKKVIMRLPEGLLELF